MAGLRRLAAMAGLLMLFANSAKGQSLADYASHSSCLIGPNYVYKLSIAAQGTLATVKVERSQKVRKGEIIA